MQTLLNVINLLIPEKGTSGNSRFHQKVPDLSNDQELFLCFGNQSQGQPLSNGEDFLIGGFGKFIVRKQAG